MNASHNSFHLDGDEDVRVSRGTNHDGIYIEDRKTRGVALVLGYDIPAADRVQFLRTLAGELTNLAYSIEEREAALAVTSDA